MRNGKSVVAMDRVDRKMSGCQTMTASYSCSEGKQQRPNENFLSLLYVSVDSRKKKFFVSKLGQANGGMYCT